jgi:trk system potassium uptake protein TrkA
LPWPGATRSNDVNQFAVIGLSTFGIALARELARDGKEVLAIDVDEQKIDLAKDFTDHAFAADATDKEALRQLGIKDVDVAVVSVGPNIAPSVMVTMYLKEMGTKLIVAKALSEDHGKLLSLVGADRVVFPQKDSAVRTAKAIQAPPIGAYMPLVEGFSILEIPSPKSFWGATLNQLSLRRRYGVSVMVIRRAEPHGAVVFPRAEDTIEEGDNLLLFGEDGNLRKIQELVGRE